MVPPVSFQSVGPGVGSSGLSISWVNSNQLVRMQNAGVMTTRIYSTIGTGGVPACNTAACTWGGAAKALTQAAQYGMTGANARNPKGAHNHTRAACG